MQLYMYSFIYQFGCNRYLVITITVSKEERLCETYGPSIGNDGPYQCGSIGHGCYKSKEQGWSSGKSPRLPPMWPGFESRRQCHMWVEFVVDSLLASTGFSPGTPDLPSPQKPTYPHQSNSIRNGRRRTPLWMRVSYR